MQYEFSKIHLNFNRLKNILKNIEEWVAIIMI